MYNFYHYRQYTIIVYRPKKMLRFDNPVTFKFPWTMVLTRVSEEILGKKRVVFPKKKMTGKT